MKLKPVEDYRTAKRKLQPYNKIWKKYAGRNSVGCCSCLFKVLKPISYQDFIEKYIKSGEQKPKGYKSYDFGKTEKELWSIAEEYYKDVMKEINKNEIDISIEDCFDDLIMHTIIETFDGQNVENVVKEIIEKKGFEVDKVEGDDDAKLGIDLKVKENGHFKAFLQIKPVSTFLGNKNESLIADRCNFFKKEQDAINKYGNVPYYYVIYEQCVDGVLRWLSLNDKFRFKLNDLCNEDGIALNKISDFKKHGFLGK